MDLFLDEHAYPQNLAVDIEAEVVYWRGCYRKMRFYRAGTSFDRYLPVIKFGYDSYFVHFRDGLEMALPALKQRYENHFPASDAMPWSTCQAIITAVWERIRADHRARCAALALHYHAGSRHALH